MSVTLSAAVTPTGSEATSPTCSPFQPVSQRRAGHQALRPIQRSCGSPGRPVLERAVPLPPHPSAARLCAGRGRSTSTGAPRTAALQPHVGRTSPSGTRQRTPRAVSGSRRGAAAGRRLLPTSRAPPPAGAAEGPGLRHRRSQRWRADSPLGACAFRGERGRRAVRGGPGR